ncbi:hypothetical protein BV25DRAFT_1838675 [Artomyces pyxidatus]|uniref:Uncharacterized protein n=1 Tax=Artomyces pyxidatus TaxID=48021 RepID=A0ACB8T013_9AGAM|nr:hypothetical protein BV25DRAFT_1838675 [Artomyces pyxidatus]
MDQSETFIHVDVARFSTRVGGLVRGRLIQQRERRWLYWTWPDLPMIEGRKMEIWMGGVVETLTVGEYMGGDGSHAYFHVGGSTFVQVSISDARVPGGWWEGVINSKPFRSRFGLGDVRRAVEGQPRWFSWNTLQRRVGKVLSRNRIKPDTVEVNCISVVPRTPELEAAYQRSAEPVSEKQGREILRTSRESEERVWWVQKDVEDRGDGEIC